LLLTKRARAWRNANGQREVDELFAHLGDSRGRTAGTGTWWTIVSEPLREG
jgi:hypothetical protein